MTSAARSWPGCYIVTVIALCDKPGATFASLLPRTGTEHHITIPAHSPLKVGTLSAVLRDVAGYLDLAREILAEELFGR